jgi:hypothetical protein
MGNMLDMLLTKHSCIVRERPQRTVLQVTRACTVQRITGAPCLAAWEDAQLWELDLNNAGVPARLWSRKEQSSGLLQEAQFTIVWKPPADLLGSMPRLKAVQSLGAGVDSILGPSFPTGIHLARIVRSKGFMGSCISRRAT